MINSVKELKKFGEVKRGVKLSRFNTFNIGGPADLMLTIEGSEQLAAALSYLRSEGMDYFVLGGGSNILFPDEGLRKVVLRPKGGKLSVNPDGIVEAEAGVQLGAVMNTSLGAGLTGFEWAAGIPGTVGGAIRGNAGARYSFIGGEAKDGLVSVRVWQDGEIIDLPVAECGFVYRGSIFKEQNAVVLSATWKLVPADKTEVLRTVQEIMKKRTAGFPPFPSAGSFFKNVALSDYGGDQSLLPEVFISRQKIPAGWLIEQCGLKGFAIGGAKISEEHGNFLVNFNEATQADVLKVVELVQEKVYNKFKTDLQSEVEIILD